MTSPWEFPDFDDHEGVHFFRDPTTGLTAIIAVHSTFRGPAGGGARFWHYASADAAITDALRLSRGMSYKNAMAGLPMGGGKGVILADVDRAKTPELFEAFGRSIETLNGRYVTAEDVGLSEEDMVSISRATRHVTGLPVADDQAGGNPGPSTSRGVYLGVLAAIRRRLGRSHPQGVHVAIQGVGSVGGGLARLLAADGARLTLADVNAERARALAVELGAETVPADDVLGVEADVFSPNALGAILDEQTIADLKVPIVAGGANNQLSRPEHGQILQRRGILYAPDYVINAGGIINVAYEYEGGRSRADVEAALTRIPTRLEQVWDESESTGEPPSMVADRMARHLIGRP
jgi:leucine dehydrogenase